MFDQLQYNVTITLDGDPEIVLIDPDEMTVGCGTSGDMRYPYPPDTTGSVGISTNLVQIFPSTQYVDVMSYCSPEHVSD